MLLKRLQFTLQAELVRHGRMAGAERRAPLRAAAGPPGGPDLWVYSNLVLFLENNF
jgi:hypothetical protein